MTCLKRAATSPLRRVQRLCWRSGAAPQHQRPIVLRRRCLAVPEATSAAHMLPSQSLMSSCGLLRDEWLAGEILLAPSSVFEPKFCDR